MNKKIEELEERINKLKAELSCLEYELKQREEPIRLLTGEEYDRYKDKIPDICCGWWLQDRVWGDDEHNKASIVACNNSISHDMVNLPWNGVRPVIDVTRLGIPLNRFKDYGRVLHYCGVTWFQINRTESWSHPSNLYIAELPIGFRRFDPESNDYEKSEIKEWLENWYEGRKDI